jgi:hypothetical protein
MIKEIEVGGVRHSIQAENTIKTTWAELKALRDESKLNAGTFYRITDYVTTTTQAKTKSANHPFDVIVLALSENTLCEDAKAILHEGDTYFADSDLSAWELKYCLDNDKTRFAWADETNGKGVIYRMIDEKRNDCPYDFKNILFYTAKFVDYTTPDNYYYTFSYVVGVVLYDSTKITKYCHGNKIKTYITPGGLTLNNIVFRNTYIGSSCHSNTFGNDCCDITFGDYCHSNTFGNGCNSTTFGDYCSYNTFGNSCSYNTLGNVCQYNTLENNCRGVRIGDSCFYRKSDGGPEKQVVTLSEEFYDDGSGQLVPIKHPDLSTQPSILPYKFMGQYVYEQLIPNITLGSLIESKTYFPSNLWLAVKENPYVISANAIIKTEFGVMTVPITTYTEFSAISFKLDPTIQFVTGIGEVKDSFLCQIHLVYTSMPEEGGYYGYNNY